MKVSNRTTRALNLISRYQQTKERILLAIQDLTVSNDRRHFGSLFTSNKTNKLLIKTASSLGDTLDPLFLLFEYGDLRYLALQSCRAKQL